MPSLDLALFMSSTTFDLETKYSILKLITVLRISDQVINSQKWTILTVEDYSYAVNLKQSFKRKKKKPESGFSMCHEAFFFFFSFLYALYFSKNAGKSCGQNVNT